AHELRNPLAPIQSALNVHKLESETEARNQLIGIIERQVHLLARLVDDLIDVARITRGKLTLRKQRVCVQDVLMAAIETVRPAIEGAEHTLRIDIQDGSVSLDADAHRLGQAFANVLNNACKYTAPGGTIWLTAACDDGQLVVSVRDTGIGLTEEQCTRIFDLFVQIDASLERARGGLGIGLTLVRQLVDMHGGSVTVHSDGPDRGSEFVIRIPIATNDESAVGLQEPSAQTIVRRTLRILIVDDNHDGADMLALTLSILGHHVSAVYDPLEAIAAAESFLPDVAFLDIGMPALNGYELAALLKRQPWASEILLVALTGWGQEENRQRSAAAGFDEHLVKPIELETIDRICQRALAQKPLEPVQTISGSRADQGT
ncbi:MAG TPA: ATP-binding protein, partial [Xanthomonadaceae bacterium]|nr:ATP-binding protein [Xanthomonadaceae bacterium]